MADTVDTITVFNGTRKAAFRFTNVYVDTGESAVIKVDISTFTGPDGRPPTATAIEEIKWDVQGYTSVRLFWDHSTDDEIMICSGQGSMSYADIGGLRDPRSSGGTGDILFTTAGTTAGNTYDITIVLRWKA